VRCWDQIEPISPCRVIEPRLPVHPRSTGGPCRNASAGGPLNQHNTSARTYTRLLFATHNMYDCVAPVSKCVRTFSPAGAPASAIQFALPAVIVSEVGLIGSPR
jgi:hypothetical protein